MSTAAKRRMVAGALLVLAVWPAVHLVLATRYAVDPWEFFGWGMYALPSPQVHVRIEQLVDGRALLVRPSQATIERLAAFSRARTRFGLFASVDALGHEILELEPHMQGVVVHLRRWSLDRETARFVVHEEQHRFVRGGSPEEAPEETRKESRTRES